jgi:hypothetical protein
MTRRKGEMPIHQFTEEQRRLRQKWFGIAETPDPWKELGPISEVRGESDPIRVENCRTGRRGVAKPGPRKAQQDYLCRAAHEKLAYDLAYLLELPVSPVVLWPEGAPDRYRRGRSISAWAFDESATWKTADELGLISAAQKEAARPIISAMRAFHIWIGDLDRDTSQIRVNLSPGDREQPLSFFDHSFSMSYLWNSADSEIYVQKTYFALPDLREVMIATADRIAQLPDDQIESIVMRVNELYLPDLTKGHILSNLLGRKAKLRDVLSAGHRREECGPDG